MIRAYNDWHLDEWCNSAPDRFIPNALLPLWGIPLTLAEVRRVLDKGCHSVCFPDNPAAHGLPPPPRLGTPVATLQRYRCAAELSSRHRHPTFPNLA